MLAALFHYRMHAPDVMRFLGGTYTGEHRDINDIVATLTTHDIDPWLITQHARARIFPMQLVEVLAMFGDEGFVRKQLLGENFYESAYWLPILGQEISAE